MSDAIQSGKQSPINQTTDYESSGVSNEAWTNKGHNVHPYDIPLCSLLVRFCPDSCPAQAWSVGTLIAFLGTVAVASTPVKSNGLGV